MRGNKIEQKRLEIVQGMTLATWIMQCVTFSMIWILYLNRLQYVPFLKLGNYMYVISYAVIAYLFMSSMGGYRFGRDRIGNIVLSQILATVCCNVIYIVQTILMIGQVGPLLDIVGFYLLLMLIQMLANMLIFIIGKKALGCLPKYRLLVIYGDYNNDLLTKLHDRDDIYEMINKVYFDEPMEILSKRIIKYDAVLINDVPSDKKNEILKYCFSHSIMTYFTPKISDIIVKGASEENLFDSPLYLCRNMELTNGNRILKRVIDLLGSIILIILTGWIMLLTAICIKVSDGGTVFYNQKRCTLHNKVFMMHKFRSMIEDAEKEKGVQLAEADDDRVTKVGKFIRRTRIDELPQLFNVLKGDMSLVGPRPERPELIEETIGSIPEFAFRTKVKAGLTGYAQVFGKYNTNFLDKLKLDMIYIERYSILLDIRILFLTIKIVFVKESSEGITEVNETEKDISKAHKCS